MTPVALIVEDDPDHLEVLSRFFRLWGWDVVGVGDAGGPITPPPGLALIVLDRALPGLSGAAVLRQLRAAGVAAPAVVVTGMPADAVAGEFVGLGTLGVFGKDEAYDRLRAIAARIAAAAGGGKTSEPVNP